MSVIELADHRKPVMYSIHVTHFWDGTIEFMVEDVADDDRSRASVAQAMRECADRLDAPDSTSASKGEG